MKTNKKNIFIGLGSIVIVLAAILAFIMLQNPSKGIKDFIIPQLNFSGITVNEISPDKAQLTLHVHMTNPSPIGISIDSLDYVIFIDSTEVVKSTYTDSLDIGRGKTSFSLPLTIFYHKLTHVIDAHDQIGLDSANYTIIAKAHMHNRLLPINNFDLEIEKKLPLIQMPEINISSVKVGDIGLSETTLDLTIHIKNPNVFSFALKNVDFQLQLSDNEVLKGKYDGVINLPPKGSEEFTSVITLSLSDATKSLFELIRKGEDLKFSFDMTSTMDSESELIEAGKMRLKVQGNIKDLKSIKD